MDKGSDTKEHFEYFHRPRLFTTDRTIITLPAGLVYTVNGKEYSLKNDVSVDLNTIIPVKDRIGRNVYIYAVPNKDGVPHFEFSLDKTSPEGYTTENSRKLGGFHCLYTDVGIYPGHLLSGYVKGDIIPASCWDLEHKPPGEEPGASVYVEPLNAWCDLYGTKANGESFHTYENDIDDTIERLFTMCESNH